jgi:hypothetical protein
MEEISMISHRVGPVIIDKVNGDDYPGDLANRPYAAFKEPDGEHKGAVVGTVEYDGGGEFHVRLDVAGRSWCFRALSVQALRDQVYRFFPGDRGRITLRLSRAADLARFGEHAAIGRL